MKQCAFIFILLISASYYINVVCYNNPNSKLSQPITELIFTVNGTISDIEFSDNTLWLASSDANQIYFGLPLYINDLRLVAGSGVAGFKDGIAEEAQFNKPTGIALSDSDNSIVYVADSGNNAIRAIVGGRVETILTNFTKLVDIAVVDIEVDILYVIDNDEIKKIEFGPINPTCATAIHFGLLTSSSIKESGTLRRATREEEDGLPYSIHPPSFAPKHLRETVWYSFIGTGDKARLDISYQDSKHKATAVVFRATDGPNGKINDCGVKQLTAVGYTLEHANSTLDSPRRLDFCTQLGMVYHIAITRAHYSSKLGKFNFTLSNIAQGVECAAECSCALVACGQSSCNGYCPNTCNTTQQCIDNECAPVAAYGKCTTAAEITALPFSTIQTTRFSLTPYAVPNCGNYNIHGPTWFKYVGSGKSVVASTCNPITQFNSFIGIFSSGSADCTAPDFTCVGKSRGGCEQNVFNTNYDLSTIAWCAEAGKTYYILVGSIYNTVANFKLDMKEIGTCVLKKKRTIATVSQQHQQQVLQSINKDSFIANGFKFEVTSFGKVPGATSIFGNTQGVWVTSSTMNKIYKLDEATLTAVDYAGSGSLTDTDGSFAAAGISRPIDVTAHVASLLVIDHGNGGSVRFLNLGSVQTVPVQIKNPQAITYASPYSTQFAPGGFVATEHEVYRISFAPTNSNCEEAKYLGVMQGNGTSFYVNDTSLYISQSTATSLKCSIYNDYDKTRYGLWYTFMGNGNQATVHTRANVLLWRHTQFGIQSCKQELLRCMKLESRTFSICTQPNMFYTLYVRGKHERALQMTITDDGKQHCDDCQCSVNAACGMNNCTGLCEKQCPFGYQCVAMAVEDKCARKAFNSKCDAALPIPNYKNSTILAAIQTSFSRIDLEDPIGQCTHIRVDGKQGLWYVIQGTNSFISVNACHEPHSGYAAIIASTNGKCGSQSADWSCVSNYDSKCDQCFFATKGIAYYILFYNYGNFVNATITVGSDCEVAPTSSSSPSYPSPYPSPRTFEYSLPSPYPSPYPAPQFSYPSPDPSPTPSPNPSSVSVGSPSPNPTPTYGAPAIDTDYFPSPYRPSPAPSPDIDYFYKKK